MPIAFGTRLAIATLALACNVTFAADASAPNDAVAFVSRAAQASMAEITAAELALKVSKDPATQTFARRMITDHRRSAAELATVAKSKSIPVPTALGAEQARKLEVLKGKQGAAFDRAYAALMVESHGEAVELFQANVANPDGEIAAYAGRTLAALQEHSRVAENLQESLPK